MQNLKCFVAATGRAVSRAALIARQQGAELHLLHVISPLALYPGMGIDLVMNAPPGSLLHAVHSMPRRGICMRVSASVPTWFSTSAGHIAKSPNTPAR